MPGADTFAPSLEAMLGFGLAQQLDTWELVTWTEGEIADDAVRPAFVLHDPPNSPDERVLIMPRSAIAVPGARGVSDVPVGIGYRGPVDGDPQLALDFMGTLARRFLRLPPMSFGGIPTSNARVTWGPLPADANRRPCASATITFRCRPAGANG